MRSLKAFNEDNTFCKVGGNLPSLDFAGLAALVGTSASTAGISYTCLVRGRVPYLNAYVTAGTLGLAQAVASCIDWRPARILIGACEAGSILTLCGAKASGNASYVGLQSGTSHPVRGIVGEAVVLELLRKGKEKFACAGDHTHDIGRDSKRPTIVVWAQIDNPDAIVGEVCVAGEQGALINMLATLICLIVLVLNVLCHEWLGVVVVATGMILNAMMGILLRMHRFELGKANPAEGVPPGDAMIYMKDDPDVFCVLRGNEKSIQRLLQREITIHPGGTQPLPLFLVSLALMAYAAVVVLGVPHMGPTAQLLFVLAVCFGATTDLIKGSWNGKRGLAKEAISMYSIRSLDAKRFMNRTAAVACVAVGSTKVDALKAAGLLPKAGEVWTKWWTVLGTRVCLSQATIKSEIQRQLDTRAAQRAEDGKPDLWTTLEADMLDGLHAVAQHLDLVFANSGLQQ